MCFAMPFYVFFIAKVAFLWQFAKCGHVFFNGRL
nr:MAG TPA: hypothetical protein [Caudoviricetes sp.]